MKKFICLLVSFCLLMSVWIIPTSALENITLFQAENTDSVPTIEGDHSISSEAGSYTYSPPDSGEFLIKNADASFSITDAGPVLQFAKYTVTLPDLNFYRIVDTSGNLRFYQADVLTDTVQTSNFVYVAIYVEGEASHTVHIQYYDKDSAILYNIVLPITAEQFTYFDEISTSFCMGDDDLSNRLKLSARIYTYGTFEDDIIDSSTYSVAPAALNPIPDYSYDLYTDDDGIIKSYVDEHFLDCYLEDFTYTDDPIIRIIPKDLFFIPGEHIYVGKEYGFFLRVVTDAYLPPEYAVDVLVFDITHAAPGYGANEAGSVKIEPLFQFKYRATRGERTDFDPSLSCAVFPHFQYDFVDYFLNDIGIRVTLDNVDELNPGDAGYDPYNDSGAFIIQTRVNISGVSLAEVNNGFAEDTVSFVLGCVPGLSTVLDAASYISDLYNGFADGEYLDTREVTTCNNEVNIDTLPRNNTDQISQYGQLIKSQSVAIKSSANNPRLIHIGGYAELKYEINRKSGSDNNKIRVITSVSVNVVYESPSNTFEQGELINYGRATGTYETGRYKRLDDVLATGYTSFGVPASTQRFAIKVIPQVSGTYKIYTSSYYGDPNFNIVNATTGTAVVNAQDDVHGANDRNAVLIIHLNAGDIYYIDAYSFNSNYGYTLRIAYNPDTSQTISVNSPIRIETTEDSFEMIKFTPSVSGYYEISTDRVSGDPQLMLFLHSGALLKSDDDSGGVLDALIRYYLVAGSTYYIAVQGFKGRTAEFDLEITLDS